MQLIQILLAAIAPAAVLICYIYRRDKYQKEPVKELLKAFGLGILSAPLALFFTSALDMSGRLSADPVTFYDAVRVSFLGAAIPEELAKFILFWLLVRKNRFFDENMDGIVYASMVSLGFAAVENILYLVMNYHNWVAVGISRALFSVPGHFFFGVLMGYYYSLYRFCPFGNQSYKWLILVAPILAHGLYDTVLFSIDVMPSLSMILMVIFLILCNSIRKRASRSIFEHLDRDRSYN